MAQFSQHSYLAQFRQKWPVEAILGNIVYLSQTLTNQIAQIGDLSQSWGSRIFKNSGIGLSQNNKKTRFFLVTVQGS